MSRTLLLTAALMTTLTLAGCGSDEPDGEASQVQTAANGDEFNAADVEFATEMVQHHAQALQMVDLTMPRRLDPQVQRLAEGIRAAQATEIEQMTDWLTDWDQPIPETVRDHANAHNDSGAESGADGGMEPEAEMPGMLSAEQMAELEAAPASSFEGLWLESMLEHHRGAVEMARTEQADGAFAAAIDTAAVIESSQLAEITHMEDLLAP